MAPPRQLGPRVRQQRRTKLVEHSEPGWLLLGRDEAGQEGEPILVAEGTVQQPGERSDGLASTAGRIPDGRLCEGVDGSRDVSARSRIVRIVQDEAQPQ